MTVPTPYSKKAVIMVMENLKVKTCSICFHEKRIEIEKTYEDPKSWRKALRKFKISQGAYYRHRLHYLVNQVDLDDLIGFKEDEKYFCEFDELWKTYNLINEILRKLMSLPMSERTLNMTARFLALRLRALEDRIQAIVRDVDESNWGEPEEKAESDESEGWTPLPEGGLVCSIPSTMDQEKERELQLKTLSEQEQIALARIIAKRDKTQSLLQQEPESTGNRKRPECPEE